METTRDCSKISEYLCITDGKIIFNSLWFQSLLYKSNIMTSSPNGNVVVQKLLLCLVYFLMLSGTLSTNNLMDEISILLYSV